MGAFAGIPASSEAVEACQEKGVDISGHVSQPLTKSLVVENDLILTMTGKHKEMILKKMPDLESKVRLLSEFAEAGLKDVEDPVGQPLEKYRAVLAQMKGFLERALAKFRV
jgi:protein-tyrosine-phosphatase